MQTRVSGRAGSEVVRRVPDTTVVAEMTDEVTGTMKAPALKVVTDEEFFEHYDPKPVNREGLNQKIEESGRYLKGKQDGIDLAFSILERNAKTTPRELGADEGEAIVEGFWPEALDLEALAETEPAPPAFIIQDWLPCGYATLFAGHGGVGKSIIALHLAVCVAAGMTFFGLKVQRRRVLYLSCEDRKNVLHWRLWRICKHLGIDMAQLRGWLVVLDLVGKKTVLWERDPRLGGTLTTAYGELCERIKRYEAQVLMVDGISDTFGGNEGTRTEVKQFVNCLVALIPEDDGAVILIGHVNRPTASGISTSEAYSGSTQWHNAARARWYLYPEKQEGENGGRAAPTGTLLLELQKSNLGAGQMDQTMAFRWDKQAGLFLADDSMDFSPRGPLRDQTHREAILAAVRGCSTSTPTVIVPTARTGPRTVYSVLSQRPEFPKGLERRKFHTLLEQLHQSGELTLEEYQDANRHRCTRFVAA